MLDILLLIQVNVLRKRQFVLFHLSFSDMETHSMDSTESNKPLKHELGLMERSSLLPVSSWLCGIISVS